MAQYTKRYNPNRSRDWNYGGSKWRLSRSKIDLFVECPRCFYLDNKLGTGRPRGPAFTLNIAVDALLKKEFDVHRVKQTTHPLLKQYGIDAVPFQHKDIDTWRENFKGLEVVHKPTGFTISGAIDDVWVRPDGELIVVDYKATSKDGTIETLADSSWAEQYERQIGVYQWLLRMLGHKVSNRGYFVYANADSDKEAFDGRLEFEITLIPTEGNTEWIEPTLFEIKKILESGEFPECFPTCEFCDYRETAGKKLQEIYHEKNKTEGKTPKLF